jgi:hypothetical protein
MPTHVAFIWYMYMQAWFDLYHGRLPYDPEFCEFTEHWLFAAHPKIELHSIERIAVDAGGQFYTSPKFRMHIYKAAEQNMTRIIENAIKDYQRHVVACLIS